MIVEQNREAFIPYTRQALISLCLSDCNLTATQKKQFQEFCQILAAYFHFKFHSYLENIKQNYTPFNPKPSQVIQSQFDLDSQTIMTKKLIEDVTTILEKANYYPLSEGVLKRALKEDSLFDLKTEVDFEDFEAMLCYCQGDRLDLIKTKKFWRTKTKKIDVFERVVLLIKFKAEKHFSDKPTAKEKLNFKPGSIYIYLYKNLSKLDLEFIFPNVRMSMTWKDRLLFGIPAIGAGISIIIKVLPQLLLIVGVIFYVVLGDIPNSVIPVREEQVRKVTPLLVTTLSLLITLGGFAFKQYTSYKNKQIKFQKNITDTLFFRNLANNLGVLQYLVDAAEEEECKEIILVYYHLLISKTLLNVKQLDDIIEVWMENKTGKKINFDINKTINNLQNIRGKIITNKNNNQEPTEVSLLKKDEQNYLHLLSLQESLQVIDYVWDRAFKYI